MSFAYFEYHDDCMGTRFSLLIDHDDQAKAEAGARAAFREAKKLELIFSDYIDHSELSRFSDSSYSSAGKGFPKSSLRFFVTDKDFPETRTVHST